MKWELKDASELRKKHPYSFFRPSDAALASIQRGDLVLVYLMVDMGNGDAFSQKAYVRVNDRDEHGNYYGYFENSSTFEDGVECVIRPENVVNVEGGCEFADADMMELCFKGCFVSENIFDKGMQATRFVREEPRADCKTRLGDDDSGWRILSGESDCELRPSLLGTILSQDDSCLPFLNSPVGSAYERVGNGREFVQTDSVPELAGAKKVTPELFDDATVVEHLSRLPKKLLDFWMGGLAKLNSAKGSPAPKDLSALSNEDFQLMKGWLCYAYEDQVSSKGRAAGDWRISDTFVKRMLGEG